MTKNVFSEKLKDISRESYQINQLVKDFYEERVCSEYKKDVLSLFNDIGYSTDKESLSTLLYALRNQIFHNYCIFDGHEEALNQVIFSFERVIIMLLSKKLINDKN